MMRRRLNVLPRAFCCLGLLLIAGCAESTINSEMPVAGRILRPDRMLVHRVQVTPLGAESGAAKATVQGETQRVGRLLGEAIALNLVAELESRGIKSGFAKESAPPEENTIWIFSRFMHNETPGSSNIIGGYAFGNPLRMRVSIYQGTGANLQFIAQADTTTTTSVQRGMAPAAEKSAVESDAKRVAKQAADRIVDFYHKRGFLQ